MTATPRRRRTCICPALRVNGQAVGADNGVDAARTWTWLRPLLVPSSKALVECVLRRGRIAPEYASDCCASSWSRQCEWMEEAA